MTRALVFDPNGWEDYLYWQTQDRKTLKRINTLIAAVVFQWRPERAPFFVRRR